LKANLTDIFKVVIVGFVLLWLFIITFRVQKSVPNTSEKILEACKELVANQTKEDLSNIPPVILPAGPAVQHGQMRYQNLVLWKNDEFKIEVKCFARSSKSSAKAVIDKLIVNGEDLTNLIKREERN